MKRNWFLLYLCIPLLLSAGALHAREGLSVSFGAAFNTDGANMGDFIEKQGIDSNNDTSGTVPKSCLQHVIVPQKMLHRWTQVDHPDAWVDVPIYDLEVDDGGMKGVNLAAYLRYDFMKRFFVRAGCEYELYVYGGGSSWKFQNMTSIQNNPLTGTGPSYGSEASQEFSYRYMMVPFTVGVNIPIEFRRKPVFNVYLGGGVSYYNGGWSVKFKAPNYYIVTLPDYIDEELEFYTSGVGFNWVFGADAAISENLFLFIEIDGFYMEKKYVSYDIKNPALYDGIFGTSMGQKLELPVDLSYTLIRVGVTFKLL